jgi:hypothetical protein
MGASGIGGIKEGRMKVKEKGRNDVALAKLNELFRDAMLKRLLEKEEEGWDGWGNRREMDKFAGGLKDRMIRNILEGDWVDVANLAMFAWNFEEE